MPDASEPGLSDGRIADLLAESALNGRRLEVQGPQVLYQPETPADHVYFLERGQVRIYQVGVQNAARLADILGGGAWLGIAALAGERLFGVRAEVVSPSILWKLDPQRLWQWMYGQPRVLTNLITQLARRLRAAQDTAARLVFNDCNQRLVSTLLQFSNSAAATPDEQGVVLHITHHELAQAVGAARETVSLALTQLRQQNLLKTGRNRLMFNPKVLMSFAQRLEDNGGRANAQAPGPGEEEKAKLQ